MSFIKVDPVSDFSFHNLPYGVFSTPDNVSTLFIFNLFFKIKPSLIWWWHVYWGVSVHGHDDSLQMYTDVCMAGMSAVMISGLSTSPGNPDMLKSLRISENVISNQTTLIECNFKGRIQTCITPNSKNTPKMTSCGQQWSGSSSNRKATDLNPRLPRVSSQCILELDTEP